jgi:menaquinone-dependent protoporphyrinogen IX oxidase
MSKILVVYSTNSGSTAEVAQAVAGELNQDGHTAEVLTIAEVKDLSGYDAIVVGAPMIFGWHNPALKFMRKHAGELAGKKTACFACAMRLTAVPGEALPPVSLEMDPNLAAAPQKPGKLNFKELFTTTGYYLKPILAAAPAIKPLSVAFFKGRLEMYRLKWWQAAFVMFVVQASPGDYRDWDYIKTWGKTLSKLL